jgi:hypothetical protein
MKKNIFAVTVAAFVAVTFCLCGAARAQSFDRATVSFTSVTNATHTTNSLVPALRGELRELCLTFTGYATPTVNVAVVKAASLSGPSETLLAAGNRTADVVLRPVAVVNTNGTAAAWFTPYAFTGEAALTIITSNACPSNVTVKVDAIYKR